jgi:hypothetical protein
MQDFRPPMTATGQLRHFGRRPTTSGLPLETDIVRAGRHVSKVPSPNLCLFTQLPYRQSRRTQEVRKAPAAWLS